jgi:hypothetical protein
MNFGTSCRAVARRFKQGGVSVKFADKPCSERMPPPPDFMVDTHTYCTHFIIDRSINVSLWTGCLRGKARSEHDILWTST